MDFMVPRLRTVLTHLEHHGTSMHVHVYTAEA